MGTTADIRAGSTVDIVLLTAAPADKAAATVAELTAGTRLECHMVGEESFSLPRSANTTDISSLCSPDVFETVTTRTNGPIEMTLWRYDDGTDVAWTALDDTTNPPAQQYLVVAPFGFTGTGDPADPVAGDTYHLYDVQVGSREPMFDRGEGTRFTASLTVQGVTMDGTVAA